MCATRELRFSRVPESESCEKTMKDLRNSVDLQYSPAEWDGNIEDNKQSTIPSNAILWLLERLRKKFCVAYFAPTYSILLKIRLIFSRKTILINFEWEQYYLEKYQAFCIWSLNPSQWTNRSGAKGNVR